MALRRIEGNLEEHLALLFKKRDELWIFYHADAGSLFTILSHSQLLILLQYLSTTTPYTPLCLARHPSKVYYWKLSIAHKMYCWEIFWKPISRSLFLIGLPYWKIEGHTCVRRLLWFPNWFTWHFISTWEDEKLFCGKKTQTSSTFFFQEDQPSIQTQTSYII